MPFCDIFFIMNRTNRRKTFFSVTVAIGSLLLAGCDMSSSVNLSSEQNELVAEYAAGKLLQYNKGHENGIEHVNDINFSEVNPGYVAPEEEEPETEDELMQSPLIEETDNQGTEDIESVDSETSFEESADAIVDATEALVDVPVVSTQKIGEALGLPEVEITYNNYELCKTYPTDETQLVFSMKASDGKELMIVHFNLSNPTCSDINVNTGTEDFKSRISVNGSSKIRGELTFLENDLLNCSDVILPGEVHDMVLVFEVDEGIAIDTLDLIIIDKDKSENAYRLIG